MYPIKLESKIDYFRVYTGVPWIIQDHYFIVRNRHCDFKADMAEGIKTAVWIRLSLLTIEFYDEESLLVIVTKLGEPLKVDNNTMESIRDRVMLGYLC